ncbi:hypothetical protein QN239_31255 [Mycolicibacterium sp. Y3]
MAAAASAAFAGTALASDDTLSPAARSANIPADPVAGWDLPTTDGRRVQLVLPAGLGAAEHTPAGQVVYPDRGAGFSVIAENQGAGGRTITRIPQPVMTGAATTPAAKATTTTSADGQVLPMVPMFLRTPPDTVMLAHTNGIITLNDATPAATTIATIAAPQARDSHGTVVPSAFVTQQIRPGLYLLAQVIHPDATTVWPVYADPCFSCMLDSVASAAQSVADATVVGAKAVGNFVKNNPLESAEIIGGSVLMVTGVGTGFGASLVLSGTTGLVQKAAAADPTNQLLAAAGDTLEVLNYVSPARSIQKGVTAAAERSVQKLDDLAENALRDVNTVKPVTPTPSPQLANDIAGTLTPKPGVGTPAAANAPPVTPLRSADDRIPLEPPPFGPVRPPTDYKPPSVSQPAGTRNDCGDVCENPATIYSQEWTPETYDNKLSGIENGQSSATVHRETDQAQIDRNRRAAQNGVPKGGRDYVLEEDNPASTKEGGQGARLTYTPKWEGDREGNQLQRTYRDQEINDGDPYDRVFRGDDGKVRCAPCAIDRRNQQQSADAARARAQANAREANDASNQGNASKTNVTNNTQDTTSRAEHRNNKHGSNNGSKKKKKQSTNKKHRKGQK